MADGDSGGILGEIGQALTNPEMEMLLPAVMGAGGGMLSAPIMGGRRAALGGALQGGAQGLTQGMSIAQKQKMDAAQLAEIQQHTQNMQLTNQQLTASIGNDQAYKAYATKMADQLPPGDKDQFLALSSKNPQEALKFYNQNNTQTRKTDADLITSVFPGTNADQIAQMPGDMRAAYRDAALKAKTEGGQLVNGTDSVYLVNKLTGQKQKLGIQPLPYMIQQMKSDTAVDVARIGAGSREDVANIGAGSREKVAGENIGSREKIAGENIGSREKIAGENITSREGIAGQANLYKKYATDVGEYNKAHSDWMKNYGVYAMMPSDQRPEGIPPEPQPPPPPDPSEAMKVSGMAPPKAPAAGSGPTAPAPPESPSATPAPGGTPPTSSPSTGSKTVPPEGPKPAESKASSKGGVPAKKESPKFPPTVKDSKLGVMKFVRTDPDGRGVYKAPDGKEYHANPTKSGS